MRRWADRGGVVAAAGQQPCDQRVGVPHVAGPPFVAAPGQLGDARYEIQQLLRADRIPANEAGTANGLGNIRDHTVTPAPDLIAERCEPAEPRKANRALADHATVGGAVRPCGSHLDSESIAVQLYFERRVVEILGGAVLPECGVRLE